MTPLEIIEKRHAVRSYRLVPISSAEAEKVKADLTMINTLEAGLHFHLVQNSPEAFGMFNKSYGMFRNAANYIAPIIDHSFSDALERAGYFGEKAVLKATEYGLGTCFISGTFSRDAIKVPLRAGQEVPFIIAIGYEDNFDKPRTLASLTKKISHLKKMQASDFFIKRGDWTLEKALAKFPYLKDGLEAIAAAPSALNKRPVRIWIGKDESEDVIRIGIPDMKDVQLIDLGIAKANFTTACPGIFDWGNGARFYLD